MCWCVPTSQAAGCLPLPAACPSSLLPNDYVGSSMSGFRVVGIDPWSPIITRPIMGNNWSHYYPFLTSPTCRCRMCSKPNIKIMQSSEEMARDNVAGDHWTSSMATSRLELNLLLAQSLTPCPANKAAGSNAVCCCWQAASRAVACRCVDTWLREQIIL